MKIRSVVAAALAIAGATGTQAQVAVNDARWDSASVAWDVGDYPDALNRLQSLLRGPGAVQYLRSAALLTGEWFQTTEIARPDQFVIRITPAAALPRWSPDGRYFAFEQTDAAGIRTHIHSGSGPGFAPLAQVPGWSLSFAPGGRQAIYIRVRETAELRRARQAVSAAGNAQEAARARTVVGEIEQRTGEIVLRDLSTGRERTIVGPRVPRTAVMFESDDAILLAAQGSEAAGLELYRIATTNGASTRLPVRTTFQAVLAPLMSDHLLVASDQNSFAIINTRTGDAVPFNGTTPTPSADGRHVVYLTRSDDGNAISIIDVAAGASRIVKQSGLPLLNPVLSPDGRRVAFQMMPREDWELFVIDADGRGELRVTREIQHDHTPRFLTNDLLLGVIGENRHRRSHVYDLRTIERTRLFHNNTIRTVSMEYAWTPSPDGTRIIIIADRDGNTISPERGVYVTDLASTVDAGQVIDRVARMATAENELRTRGQAMFAPIASMVRDVVQHASVSRVYGYEHALFQFDSKHITQPGNQKAIEYIAAMLRSWGYEPEIQWFEARGVRTANVIATLRGTVNPELLYVVSSHFDSVERGPGADDNTSGTAALLEAARILAGRPMPATIKFAFFTGEEAGLLGSREYVRRAVAAGDRIVGALNNDMIGYANDNRLDNTIRYSNDGLRDLQHAAAIGFTDLITYDSRYYQNTDAHAYYEAYGDIVAGIGSYPILGNPHYHQPHDVLETINHRLVTEVAKATVASLMAMASSPSRLAGLKATRSGNRTQVAWTPAAERGVTDYIVTWGPASSPASQHLRVSSPSATLPSMPAGSIVAVKAMNGAGLEGWDWARTVVD